LLTPTKAQLYNLRNISITYIAPTCFGIVVILHAETCRSLVPKRIHRLWNCKFVGVTRVSTYHNARNEQYKNVITYYK